MVMPVMGLFPDYSPSLARKDMEMLQIQDASDLLMFHVVNLKKGQTSYCESQRAYSFKYPNGCGFTSSDQ